MMHILQFICLFNSVWLCSAIKEILTTYTCESGIRTQVASWTDSRRECHQTWTVAKSNQVIGEYEENRQPGCILPCKDLQSGKIKIDDCVDLELTVVCTSDEPDSDKIKTIYVEETHVFFRANRPRAYNRVEGIFHLHWMAVAVMIGVGWAIFFNT